MKIAKNSDDLAELRSELDASQAYAIKPELCDALMERVFDEIQYSGFEIISIQLVYDMIITCDLTGLQPAPRQVGSKSVTARNSSLSVRSESHTIGLVSQDFQRLISNTQIVSLGGMDSMASVPAFQESAAHRDAENLRRVHPTRKDVREVPPRGATSDAIRIETTVQGKPRVPAKRAPFDTGLQEPLDTGAPPLQEPSPHNKSARIAVEASPARKVVSDLNVRAAPLKVSAEQAQNSETPMRGAESGVGVHRSCRNEASHPPVGELEISCGQDRIPQKPKNAPRPNIFAPPSQPEPASRKPLRQEIINLEEPALRDADLEDENCSGHATEGAEAMPTREEPPGKQLEVAVEGEWNSCQSQDDPSRESHSRESNSQEMNFAFYCAETSWLCVSEHPAVEVFAVSARMIEGSQNVKRFRGKGGSAPTQAKFSLTFEVYQGDKVNIF